MMKRTGRRRLVSAVVAIGLCVAPACSSSSDGSTATSTTSKASSTSTTEAGSSTTKAGSSTTTAGPSTTVDLAPVEVSAIGTYAVGSRQETYVDRSRPTPANADKPALPQRTLPAVVLYPATGEPGPDQVVDGAPAKGPFPLILFSHGVTGRGVEYAATLRVFASAGYVVVAPDYPLSNRNAVGGPVISDVPNQIEDVPFLLDQVLAANGAPGYLEGLIDPDRVGLAGHSLGAITSLGAGYTTCCADPRVKAVTEWAGLFFSKDSAPAEPPSALAPIAAHRPLLMIHGTEDKTVPFAVTKGVYGAVGTPKALISLPGQGHIPVYVTGESSPASKVVADAVVAFFDATLKGDPTGFDRVAQVVADAGPDVATLQKDLN